MTVNIQSGTASGTVVVPPSKSMAHRLLICAGLSKGKSIIHNVDFNEDILATLDCLTALGVSCKIDGNTVTVTGTDFRTAEPEIPLHCRESGSTLRFLIPLGLLSGNSVTFTGSEILLSRPLQVYEEICKSQGIQYTATTDSLQVQGILSGGEYRIPGNISSQFISGLLFALPLLGTDSKIQLTETVESRSYIDMTLDALSRFGVHASWLDEQTLIIQGNQEYHPAELTVEGDYSAAAFFGGMNALGGNVEIQGMNPDSLQGDKVFESYFNALRQGFANIHIGNCPDLGPILFAVAASNHGGRFTGTRRLKLKESDRAAAMAKELSTFGVEVNVNEDFVTVIAHPLHRPALPCNGHNDHRIVMALAVLMTLTGGSIEGAEAVRKSYPDFFERLRDLGIELFIT